MSLYIEVDGKKVLLDAGQSDIYIKNAESLGIDLNNIDLITLSHHHFDHIDGLKCISLNSKKDLVVHPELISKLKHETLDIFLKKFNVITSKNIYKISNSIFVLGEIHRSNSFEAGVYNEDGIFDEMIDDTALVIKTKRGLIVISGCSHTGICNICEHAKK